MCFFCHVRIVVKPKLFNSWSVSVRYKAATDAALAMDPPSLSAFGNAIVLQGCFSSRKSAQCKGRQGWRLRVNDQFASQTGSAWMPLCRIVAAYPSNHFRKHKHYTLVQRSLFSILGPGYQG